jgi:uncharacterized iron-regulated membrane protein
MKLRPFALGLHRYAGVLAGLLLVVISITGSLLVFNEELDHRLNPQLLHITPQVEQLSIQTIVDIAQTAQPDLKTHRIIVPQKLDRAYEVLMESSKDEYIDVYINPYTGAVLGSRPYQQTVRRLLVNLHASFFAGDLGWNLAGVCGVAFVLLSFTGAVLWNGWRSVKQGFKIRWRSPKHLLNYDLHKTVGILSAALLAILGLTGAAINFSDPVEKAVYWLTHTPPPLAKPVSRAGSGAAPLGIDALLANAKAALPEAEFSRIYPAKQPDDAFMVLMHVPHRNEFNNGISLFLDQYTGKLLRRDDPGKASLGDRILNTLHTLHFGTYGGLVSRSLYFIVGLAPLGLLITGLTLWQQRRWAAARRKATIEVTKH